MAEIKEPIRIRRKKLTNGNVSLYLDIYLNGKREYEFLKLYPSPCIFHCGRHTFAVMMLDLGTDIYTVSKLLGHRELSTTQIYAKVLDKNKQAAVAKIPDIF